MTSQIDATKPTSGNALTADVRANFLTARDEIGDLQSRIAALETGHFIRVSAVNDALNQAVNNGGFLQFDTVNFDSDGFAPATTPFDTLTIPVGLGGIYMLAAWASSTGNQSTTLGMGVLINGAQAFSTTNQAIAGPQSVNYTLDCGVVEIGRLMAGDTLRLINTSVSIGTNVFRSVSLALARMSPS